MMRLPLLIVRYVIIADYRTAPTGCAGPHYAEAAGLTMLPPASPHDDKPLHVVFGVQGLTAKKARTRLAAKLSSA